MIQLLQNIEPINGVYRLSDPSRFSLLENIYLKTRRTEARVYSDEVVIKLPIIDERSGHKVEWGIRANSTQKLIKYFRSKSKTLTILDLGCGNGWMSNLLAQIQGSEVYAVDVNLYELEQGARVFKDTARLKFVYADIVEEFKLENTFDVIIMAGSIQYFPDIKQLIGKLLQHLTDHGELHVIDSPFYSAEEALKATRRTENYARSIGVPEFAQYYHHHCINDLKGFHVAELYDPESLANRVLRKILHLPLSPFPWMRITK